jgi:membrane-bound serine protease (ClpP class)
MNTQIRRITVLLLTCIVILCATGATASAGGEFDVITVNSAITPAVARYVEKNIIDSYERNAKGLIIMLDTPGGLDLAMRDIVKSILGSPIPILVYVAPSGARAASAGVMITMAAHVAAMAPGTNIGAAHPVALGVGGTMDETMAKKVENDAVAYVVSIAEKRKRNSKWAEDAVRKSASITAEEALSLKVIDMMAESLESLLVQSQGKRIALPGGEVILDTKDTLIHERKMGVRDRILTTLSDPNIAYLLLIVGLAGLYFEFAHPGAVLPGVVGGISLILAFFAMQTLPVNYAGVALIIFAIILFIAEIKIISHGMLTVAGIISLVLGSLMLFESPVPALQVSFKVMIPTIIAISLFFIAVISLAVRAQLNKPTDGIEAMRGKEGKAVTDVYGEGRVEVGGELWNASSSEPITIGERVKVTGIEGLALVVEKMKGGKSHVY